MKKTSVLQRVFAAVIALVAWFAVTHQLKLMLDSRAAPAGELIIRFFSFFTILSNIAVAVVTTNLAFTRNQSATPFLTRQTTLTAIAVYIFIVMLIYNAILRFLWHPVGAARVLDEMLHVAVPLLYLLFWYLFVPQQKLKAVAILPWLIVPALYIVYVLIRGSVSGFYPYPFINVTELGISRVLFHSVLIAIAFALTSLVFVAVGNYKVKRSG